MINRIFKFSQRSVEALPSPPPDHPSSNVEYTDAVESGLRVAVYRSGRRSFRHRFTYRGRKLLMTLGEFPAVSVEKARERVRANKALLAEDCNPLEERERKASVPSLADFVANDFLPWARQERRSLRDLENRIKNHLLPAFGKRQINQVTRRDVATFHQELREKVSPTTSNRSLSLLSGIFRRAIDMGVILENPCRGVKKAREAGARKRVLSGEELPRFMRAVTAETRTLPGMALALLIATGLRKMEVLSLSWSNIDLSQRRLFLPHTKSKVPRYVALNSQALDLLQKMAAKRIAECDWVFPSDSRTGHLLDVRRTFEGVCAAAGIVGLRLHDLRRTHASILVNAGVPILQVRDILGHADVRTTQIYAHLNTTSLGIASEVAAGELRKALIDAA